MRRINQVCKAFRENSFSSSNRLNNGVPSTASILIDSVSCKIPIVYPHFKTKEMYENEDTDKVFVEMTISNRQWLNSFASNIIDKGHNDNYVFYNSSLDIEKPGICAFRIINDYGFVQVQVQRVPKYPSLFQLDYWDKLATGEMRLKLVALCSLLAYEHPIVDVIYSDYYDEKRAMDYASVIGTTFQDVLVYMRPWDYSCGAKSITVEPIKLPGWI